VYKDSNVIKYTKNFISRKVRCTRVQKLQHNIQILRRGVVNWCYTGNKTGETSLDFSLCKMRKGAQNEIFRAEFQELVNEKYNDHTRIFTVGSNKKEKVGYAVVTNQQSTRRRRSHKSSIFSAEQEATDNGVRGVIYTDSLSTMMAASGTNHTENPKTRKIRQLMDQ
jgi:hypothetical protein